MHDAVIFGLESQSVALARLLRANGWQVKIAAWQVNPQEELEVADIEILSIPDLSLETLRKLELEHADAVVGMLTNDENYEICELVSEHFGIKNMIVRLTEREESDRFARVGAVVFEPAAAMVSLLDHFVRVPAATALLMDREENQRVVDVQLLNPNLHGLCIRDLDLPLEVLIMSVHRNGTTLVSHGYTELALGDWVTVVGSIEGLQEVTLHFEDWTRHEVLQNQTQ